MTDISPCSTWLPHPLSHYLIYRSGFSLLSQLSFISPHCPCFVPIGATTWTDELEQGTDPAEKTSEKSPSFRSIISLIWITAFLSKNALTQGQDRYKETGPLRSWACCATFSIFFSSFRDFGRELMRSYMVLKHFIDPFMSMQSDRASIFKIPSLLSWKVANYHRSLLATCLRQQFQCSKALAACINLNMQIYGVLWVKIGFLGDDPVVLGIILTFKSKAETSIPAHPVGHKDHNQFYFVC